MTYKGFSAFWAASFSGGEACVFKVWTIDPVLGPAQRGRPRRCGMGSVAYRLCHSPCRRNSSGHLHFAELRRSLDTGLVPARAGYIHFACELTAEFNAELVERFVRRTSLQVASTFAIRTGPIG